MSDLHVLPLLRLGKHRPNTCLSGIHTLGIWLGWLHPAQPKKQDEAATCEPNKQYVTVHLNGRVTAVLFLVFWSLSVQSSSSTVMSVCVCVCTCLHIFARTENWHAAIPAGTSSRV